MRNLNKNLISWLIGVVALLPSFVNAQTDFTLYHMQMVPYRMYQNPALTPQASSFVGTPVIGSIYAQGQNAFRYKDVLTKDSDDSLKLDIDNLLTKLDDLNYLFTNASIDLLSFGFRAKEKHYITFSVSQQSIAKSMYPKDLINFVWKGNAAIGLDKELELCPRVDAMVFNEFALGLAEKIDDQLSIGIRLKLLNGQANIYSEKAKASFYTDPNDYSFRINSDLLIRTSGIDNPDNKSNKDLIIGGNFGFGVDLGATYKLNNKFSFSASLLNLGYIKWKNQLLTLKSRNPGADIKFEGININDYINKDKSLDDAFKAILDSLADKLKIDTLYNQSYKTNLPMRFYAGADYTFNDKNTLGILFHGQSYNSKFFPSLSLSYYKQLGNTLGLSASYNIMNKTYNNIGLGFSLNLGEMQIYAATDNIFAIPDLKTAQNAHLHAGIVWTFGRKPKGKIHNGVVGTPIL